MTENSKEHWKQEARDLLHDCDRSARYHTLRRAFYDRIHKWMMAAVVLGGSAAVAMVSQKLLDEKSSWLLLTIFVPTLMGAIDLIWNPSGRSRDHEILSKRFYWAAKNIDEENADVANVREWKSSLLNIYEDEPDVFHALNAECYNAATKALGYEKKKLQKIGWWPRRLRHWVRYTGERFETSEGSTTP